MVVTRPQRYRDELQAHYTASTPIVSFMVSRLRHGDGDVIWEPCAGAGDLIDGLLKVNPHATIRASELNPDAASLLSEKYRGTSVDVHQEDALDFGLPSLFDSPVSFTRIIANPPYGAYQSPERRKQLQSRFKNVYVRESYGLILFHSLSLLDEKGRLVFIVPDTFLWLTRHKALRETLLRETTIEELALFPSNFFPNINFGYSGLCIITVRKERPRANHEIRIATKFENADSFLDCIGKKESNWPCAVSYVSQEDVASQSHSELVYQNGGNGIAISSRASEAIEEYAEFKTGFYSGNDRRWIRKSAETVRRSKPYTLIESLEIARQQPTLEGFEGKAAFIPIVRGGAIPFVKETHWYVDWNVNAICEYRRRGKNPARFQNSAFYFREGLGVPMVASGRLTAALLEGRLFDQGIVGVFPKEPRYLLFLLGFFNSVIATGLVRQINPTANNSANYLKRLPFVVPNQSELATANKIVKAAISEAKQCGAVSDELQQRIDEFYSRLWQDNEL